jgi:hypothetical protein
MSRLSFCALDTAENQDQCSRESKFVNGYRGSNERGVGDSNSRGCKQPSTVLGRVQYPHWEHSPKPGRALRTIS